MVMGLVDIVGEMRGSERCRGCDASRCQNLMQAGLQRPQENSEVWMRVETGERWLYIHVAPGLCESL